MFLRAAAQPRALSQRRRTTIVSFPCLAYEVLQHRFDPVEVLVLPRVVALLLGLPLLTFLGSIEALYGGALVCWIYGGLNLAVFLPRPDAPMPLSHFAVGIGQAHISALVLGERP